MHPTSVLERHHVTVAGNLAAQRSIIFAHGFGTDQTAWDAIVPAFAADHRIIRFDNAGAGRAAPEAFVQHRYLGLKGYANDLVEIADALDVHNAVLVGHSVGAMIAALAALAKPVRFARLVLVGASPRYLDTDGYHGGLTREDLDRVYSAVVENFPQWVDHYAAQAMANPERPHLAASFANTLRVIPPDRALTVLCSILQSDHRADLLALRQPTLIVQARDDIFVPLDVAHWLRDHIPHAALRIIDATGHFPHLSAPDQVIAALREFIDLPPPPAA